MPPNYKGKYGAERCADLYCIDENAKSCIRLNPNISSAIAKIALNHSCAKANVFENID